jgi:hypothetical protein
MKKLSLVIFALFLLTNLHAQKTIQSSHKKAPGWMTENIVSQTNDYVYTKTMGEGNTLKDAQEKTHFNILKQMASRDSLTISLVQEDQQKVVQQTFGDSTKFKEFYEKNAEMITKSKDIKVHGLRKVDEYWELKQFGNKIVYHNYALYRTPKYPHVHPDGFNIDKYSLFNKKYSLTYQSFTSNYKINGLNYRVLIPGWSQLYKKQNGKGILLLTATGIAASGLIVSQVQYADNFDKAQSYRGTNVNYYNTYKANYEDWNQVRLGSGIALGVIYIYNLIDALASDGAKRYAYNQKRLKISPNYDGQNYLLTLNIALK